MLTQAANDGTSTNPPHPLSNDAGNWTGCANGAGLLSGTYRDVSACFLSAKLGYPVTGTMLRQLTFQDVSNLFLQIWNDIGANQLTDQDVANIYMHIKLHYGNIRVAQRALNKMGENLSTDGVPGPLTIAAMVRQTNKNATRTYNMIRDELRIAYESNTVVAYRAPFLTALNTYFPVKSSGGSSMGLVGGVAALGLGYLVYTEFKKRKKSA